MAVSIEKDLQALEKSLVSLQIDYERFFSGDLRHPPVRIRKGIEEILRRAGNSKVDKAAERFRLQSLQGRYTALTELWEKRLQAREEGRGQPLRALPFPPPRLEDTGALPRSPKVAEQPGAAPIIPGSSEMRASLKQVSGERDAPSLASVEEGREAKQSGMRPLFERYCDARRGLGEDVSRLRYQRFMEIVTQQATEIRRSTGATKLVFEVQTLDGKVRLVGRPVSPKGAK